jgi:hypothetical protein
MNSTPGIPDISALPTSGSVARDLDDYLAWIGVDGLVAALASPGIMAVVDQHAAAIRETLAERDRSGHAALLAYARSVVAGAFRTAHPLPENGADVEWDRADWYTLRLVAVCRLALEEGDIC